MVVCLLSLEASSACNFIISFYCLWFPDSLTEDLASPYNSTVCKISTDKLHSACCITSDVLQRNLWMEFNFNPCDYLLEISLENINEKIGLFNYQWGKCSLYTKINYSMLLIFRKPSQPIRKMAAIDCNSVLYTVVLSLPEDVWAWVSYKGYLCPLEENCVIIENIIYVDLFSCVVFF